MIMVVIICAYGGVITSFLAIEIPETPFTNINGFLENGQFNVAFKAGTFLHSVIALVKHYKRTNFPYTYCGKNLFLYSGSTNASLEESI